MGEHFVQRDDFDAMPLQKFKKLPENQRIAVAMQGKSILAFDADKTVIDDLTVCVKAAVNDLPFFK